MRDELNLMDLADRYLRGELNTADHAAFEERMRANPELRQLVEDQRALHGGMQRLALRPAVAKAYRSHKFGKWGPGVGGAAIVAVLAVGGWMLAKEHITLGADEDRNPDAMELVALPDTASISLPSLVMTIDPKADTTLITPNGLVLDIPQGAFIDSEGRTITTPVRVTMLEAIDGVDIMKAGLSTMAGDTLLETGGMFYIDAQVDGKRVGIDPAKPLTVMVPSDKADPRMMLYEGVMTEDGVVDWRNPQPLPRTLVPVDITTLDFYPPGYLAKMAELGKDATDKGYTDSLYFSFTRPLEHRSSAKWEWTRPERYFESDTASYSPFPLGQTLFYKHCASCHKTTQDLTGPALQGAKARWAGKGNVYDFVRNSGQVIASGNAYANELFNKWNKSVKPPINLTYAEIEAILYWVDHARSEVKGIDPAKVKAIWNERFNGTNLATREFEERMREIHRTCDNVVLDLYANNLDKDLSELDARAGRMGHSVFTRFAERNDGRVALPEHAAERLRKVYERWSRAEAEAIRRTRETFQAEQDRQDMNAANRRGERAAKDIQNDRERFRREYDANFADACRQLGIQKTGPIPEPPITAYVANVTNPGWWNVDRAVFQSTADRKSMSFTDSTTGKTATLTYTPVTIEVVAKETFSELRVYLIPKALNSYQRVTEADGAFTERLNALFQYDLICMGRKGGQQYAASRRDISGEALVTITMEPTDDEGLRRMVRTPQVSASLVNDLMEQARHLEWLELEAKRQQARRVREELRNALLPVVFPCAGEGFPTGEPAASASVDTLQ